MSEKLKCANCDHVAEEIEWSEEWSDRKGDFVICCPNCSGVGFFVVEDAQPEDDGDDWDGLDDVDEEV